LVRGKALPDLSALNRTSVLKLRITSEPLNRVTQLSVVPSNQCLGGVDVRGREESLLQ
jgi:hypothetical protein